MCKFVYYFIFSLLVLLMPTRLCAEKCLNLTNYRTEQGLSSNYISNLFVDSRGFLWIATDYGLNRFDGAVVRSYTTDNSPSLFSNELLQVFATNDGTLLVSGYNGFFQKYTLQADTFSSVLPPDFIETIGKIYYDNHRQTIYALSSEGIYQSKCGDFRFTKDVLNGVKDLEMAKNLFRDDYGNYWVSFPDHLSVFNKEGKCIQVMKPSGQSKHTLIPQFFDLCTGRVIVSYQDDKIDFFHTTSSGEVVLEKSVKLPFSNLRDIKVAIDGSYWFATDGEGLWMSASEPDASSNIDRVVPFGKDPDELGKIYCIETDKQGNVWVGTQNTGLWRYSVRNLSSSFSSADYGIPNCHVNAFCEQVPGSILTACDGFGVYEFSEKTGSSVCYSLQDGLTNKNLTNIQCGRDKQVFATTWGGGLFFATRKNGRLSFSKDPLNGIVDPQFNIVNALEMSDGTIWLCVGDDGLYRRDNNGIWNRLVLRSSIEDRIEHWPSFAIEDENGKLWLSTSSAVWTNSFDSLRTIDEKAFVGNSKYVVNDVLNVPGYGVILATRTGMVVAKKGSDKFEPVSCCPKKEVMSLVLDKKNRLWGVVENSIWCFDLKKDSARRYAKNFDTHGHNFFLKHSKFCSQNGYVYFGTKDGFFCFEPDEFNVDTKPKKIYFSRIMADGLQVKNHNSLSDGKPETVHLHYGRNFFSVHVDMPDFSNERPSLVYRLSDDDDWHKVGPDQLISFSYLPTGTYLMEVKTIDGDDASSVCLKLVVDSPWWASWWFRSLCVLLLFMAVGWKVYTINRDKKVLQRMVDERTSELNQKSLLVEKRNQELNVALSTKDRLMAVVAHDLKNPIFAIVGALEGLRRKNDSLPADERADVLDNMIERANTLQNEMGKLLVWATSNQTEMDYRPANANLAEIINSDVELLQMQAEEKGVDIVCDINLPNYVYADARMLSTAIRNVLGNSLKFTPAGRSVTVRAWQEGEKALVEIADEGVGMTQEKLNELLEKEVNDSSKGTAGEGGTGLGVGLAKFYTTTNGGTFSMSSVLNVGTTTFLEFPATAIPIQQSVLSKNLNVNVKNVAVDAELLQGNRILVVDDDPLIVQNVKSMLENYVDVITAANGREAGELIKQQEVDVVVSDVEMPEMNGIEMANTLAADERFNHIPVLFLSAKSTESDRLLGLLTGAVDYIPKPFSQSELLVKLNNILALRQHQQKRLLEQIVPQNVDADNAKGEDLDAEDEGNVAMNPYLQQVVADIEKNYSDENYSVEQMASNLCTTRITLYRKVKSISGKNPSDLLNDYRLNMAHKMLQTGEMDLQTVSEKVGFSDYTYFSRRFKARFGYSPKQVASK